MRKNKAPKEPINPRVRANVYALAALYLVYLFYQVAKPYLTRDPYGPTGFQFLLGVVILGGGAAALGFLAWRMYKAAKAQEAALLPEEEGSEEPEALEDCEESGEDREN